MATVTGFEGLRHPRRADLRQFSELFEPLFAASSDEARRQAAAALSQCPHVPQSVALVIGTAPVSIAAIFLTRSTSISDATLLQIIRSQGPGHASAIARRDNLSVHVVDALVERRQTSVAPSRSDTLARSATPAKSDTPARSAIPAPSVPAAAHAATPDQAAARQQREETLRNEIKALARAPAAPAASGPVIEPLIDLHAALLVRFARTGEANLFAATLAAALSCDLPLAERMVLDITGQQLAIALTALGMQEADILVVLARLYPDLAERFGGTTRGGALLASLTLEASRSRLQGWLAAEKEETETRAEHRPYHAPERSADPRRAPVREERGALGTDGIQKQQAFGRRR